MLSSEAGALNKTTMWGEIYLIGLGDTEVSIMPHFNEVRVIDMIVDVSIDDPFDVEVRDHLVQSAKAYWVGRTAEEWENMRNLEHLKHLQTRTPDYLRPRPPHEEPWSTRLIRYAIWALTIFVVGILAAFLAGFILRHGHY
jgi:hypothetical protein